MDLNKKFTYLLKYMINIKDQLLMRKCLQDNFPEIAIKMFYKYFANQSPIILDIRQLLVKFAVVNLYT